MSKIIEPRLPSGFCDWDSNQAMARRRVLQIIEEQYLLMGSTPLETPAVEYEDVLIGVEDYSKQLYRVVRRGTDDGEEVEKNPLALRFDLTVPLARYVAAHPELPMPFIRHQVGQVWRGERKQQGRYHEFTQFDIDIVGTSSLVADAQILATMYNVMTALVGDRFVIKYSHRGLLNELLDKSGISSERHEEVMRLMDKFDKAGVEGTKKLLVDSRVSSEVAKNLVAILQGKVSTSDLKAMTEVNNLRELIGALGVPASHCKFDPAIVRGLGYYTGPVWETVLLDAPEFGSVYSGGRYDNLLERFGSRSLPATGTSIGVDRLMAALEKLGKLKEIVSGGVQVVVVNFGEEFISEQLKMVADLRKVGIRTEFYLGKEKGLGQQIGYAEGRGAKIVVLYGTDEQKEKKVTLKNLATKEQIQVSVTDVVSAIRRLLHI